ncbi:MAG TPA: hypothetical protein VF772_00440 [Terriglobales bacterium]
MGGSILFEMSAFPRDKHDDWVDASSGRAAEELRAASIIPCLPPAFTSGVRVLAVMPLLMRPEQMGLQFSF